MTSLNTLNTERCLTVNGLEYRYFSLPAAEQAGLEGISALPFSLKILLENLLRHEDGTTVTRDDIQAIAAWLKNKTSSREIAYRPARVLMQDFTGVPAIVDLAALRDALQNMGGDPAWINPLTPVDLVIDHSIQVDAAGSSAAMATNTRLEMARNQERYEFLRWGQQAFNNFRVVPPETGICHQINLEYLAKTVWTQTINGKTFAYPDTLVGTDSHTTMVNALGVLGWGVGGIEAEAAMLGQSISMLIPEVVGVKLTGKLVEGVTATDLVLTLTHILRKHGVVGKFVEYYGSGLSYLALADRATLANMAPEYGATCGFFPIDGATLDYLELTGRDEQTISLVEAYAKKQGLWYDSANPDPVFTDIVEVDLSAIVPCLAGPKRPQDNIPLARVGSTFQDLLTESKRSNESQVAFATRDDFSLHHGDIVIAAITSCTNTSNPTVLMAAGLLAKNAINKGLKIKPWVKASLAPGSQVVTRYLAESGLQPYLDQLGFNVVGYGCTTCIGNSGPLSEAVAETVQKNDLVVSAVLSGNRNFEGRIHPLVKANWLASPPLVVAYALAGNTVIDLTREPLGVDTLNQPVYLKDIWPSNNDVTAAVTNISRTMYAEQYQDVFSGKPDWQNLPVPSSQTYAWKKDSTYIQNPPFFTSITVQPAPLQAMQSARILAILGDSITTDHISPAGSIKSDSPAGNYLLNHGVPIQDFNSLGARRGNHEVMMRGTFANIRIKNEMLAGKEGGFTQYIPTGEILPIYDAAMRYAADQTPLIIIAGKEYGTGSSRDWAAKGPKLLGVKAVFAESFERIHRSNLIGMGILPLEFLPGQTRKTLNLKGNETFDLLDLNTIDKPRTTLPVIIHYANGENRTIHVLCRIDTANEIDYFKHGGVLHYVLRQILKKNHSTKHRSA